MSELKQQRWAIISERGVEACGLSYEDALRLMRSLDGEKVYGLCLVTDEAARRDANQPISGSKFKVQGSRFKTRD